MVDQYTQFKGVTSIGNTLFSNEIENNLKTYLDWGFLNIGGFVNVTIPTSSSFGGYFHTLKMANDPAYTAGTVWETIRKDWVWETGVNYNGQSPIAISGVWINNQFFAPNHATYGHYYDYKNGRVIFSGAVPAASSVAMNYSYRWVQVHLSEDADWFYQGQYASLKPGETQWASSHPNSGDYAIPPQHRIQFPCVIIECVPRTVARPYELGNTVLWVEQDVLFNIVAENKTARNNIKDTLFLEDDHIIWLYNSNDVARSGYNAIDYRGMLVNSTGTYPYLVNNFRWKQARFKDTNVSEVESLNTNLYEASVRTSLELILGLI